MLYVMLCDCVVLCGVDNVVISGDVVCYSVVYDILVGVSVFSIMCSELLIMSEICLPLCLSLCEYQSVESGMLGHIVCDICVYGVVV